MPSLNPGARLDRYQIDAFLGAGGMGEVYRAFDTHLRRWVALKVLARMVSLGPDVTRSLAPVARMLDEARAAATIHHPNAVTVFDAGECDGVPYIAMELVEGVALRTFLRDPTIAIERRLRWLVEVAAALGAAHARGLVHRDVKPSNVMVCADDSAKLLDFGVARLYDDSLPPSSRGPGAVVVGTPSYMAPEQLRGERVDGRADQFAWGLVAFELLAWFPPRNFSADFCHEKLWMGRPESLSAVASEVPPAVSLVVMRALQHRPDARFVSMQDAIADLVAAVPSLTTSRSVVVVATSSPPMMTADRVDPSTRTGPPTTHSGLRGAHRTEASTRREGPLPAAVVQRSRARTAIVVLSTTAAIAVLVGVGLTIALWPQHAPTGAALSAPPDAQVATVPVVAAGPSAPSSVPTAPPSSRPSAPATAPSQPAPPSSHPATKALSVTFNVSAADIRTRGALYSAFEARRPSITTCYGQPYVDRANPPATTISANWGANGMGTGIVSSSDPRMAACMRSLFANVVVLGVGAGSGTGQVVAH